MKTESFSDRHIGPNPQEIQHMLQAVKASSLETLMDECVPRGIRQKKDLDLPAAKSEVELLSHLRKLAEQNQVYRSYIGMGYSGTITPGVIQRNILENPGWYTQYTPYQAEISQGRLTALLNFQTMISDLTGLEISNASLLDEATAAAEAMSLCYAVNQKVQSKRIFVSEDCHPQTIAVVQSRAEPLGIEVLLGDHQNFNFDQEVFACLLQYPTSTGAVFDYSAFIDKAHGHQSLVILAADLLSLALLKSPGEMGADVAVGSSQRFGVPLGYGGPHAAFMATRADYKRNIPGRLIGVSKDRLGEPAVRLALQTREQHIRRDKATSNICTAQVLLAIMASMYAVYHGPQGLRRIARQVANLTAALAQELKKAGWEIRYKDFFDTLEISAQPDAIKQVLERAEKKKINLRVLAAGSLALSLDETVNIEDLNDLLEVFTGKSSSLSEAQWIQSENSAAQTYARKSEYLTHPVFNRHHSETEMLRYIKKLESKDLSLTTSMIPLGSCTMKLNATTEMYPVSWPEFSQLHPFVPLSQSRGYVQMIEDLCSYLAEITGYHSVSMQPNAGSQGEYAGLLVIRKYHLERGQGHRNICLTPQSAHGTNPASATMCGMKVVVVKTDKDGNIDYADLKAKCEQYSKDLAVLMVTYPSTHGVFEENIREVCDLVHDHGGQVYLDGANLNAQIGYCRPGDYGADVSHLNLHKTFCIPHGGGGPGMGPIGVREHLAAFLPGHPVIATGGKKAIGAISAAPWGSPSILPISYSYIRMMGADGLKRATQVAILNANYLAERLNPHYPVLYRGARGRVAHECIVDIRDLKAKSGIEVEDVAKRLMDYGFHAPTVSFPVAGTLMIEPTESESLAELDRFCEAMIAIREEIRKIESGEWDKLNNPLKNAPHSAPVIASDQWDHPYSRETAAYPVDGLKLYKFWPPVARIDSVYGDRNLICSCPSVDAYS